MIARRGLEPVRGDRGAGGLDLCVFGLVVMATWTVVVKFLAPVLFYLSERYAGRPIAEPPVMWDFWWVAHLGLAWLLWHRHPLSLPAGLGIAGAESLIVIAKLVIYVRQPDLSFWGLLWLTNKVYVLSFFLFLLVYLSRGNVRRALGGDP
ncbi:MAG TPA: hypothetical protein VN493_20140 [Thermoanaerobaculia bacterium]|nr:hypothetical protein [Thermoanaerobaculia bacterium]